MQTRIEELCNRPVITPPRDLESEPITRQEILDCLLLTAALEREHAGSSSSRRSREWRVTVTV